MLSRTLQDRSARVIFMMIIMAFAEDNASVGIIVEMRDELLSDRISSVPLAGASRVRVDC